MSSSDVRLVVLLLLASGLLLCVPGPVEAEPSAGATPPAEPVPEKGDRLPDGDDTDPKAGDDEAGEGDCVDRTGGDLVVPCSPAKAPSRGYRLRLRNHTEGALSAGKTRTWIGPPVPDDVALTVGDTELLLLDPVVTPEGEEGHLALYRQPYGAGQGGCDLSTRTNCRYVARLYTTDGREQWSIALHTHLSRPDYLEIQDIRYVDGTLYFNEACQSYAADGEGRCSSLVAFDPQQERVMWRTGHLVSNFRLLVHGRYVVTGYGFTDEPAYLHVVDRRSGDVAIRQKLPSEARHYELDADGLLHVELDDDPDLVVRPLDFEQPIPRIEVVKPPTPP